MIKNNVGGGAKKHLAYWMEKPQPPKEGNMQ